MYVFVSWAYRTEAEKAEIRRIEWVNSIREKHPLESTDDLDANSQVEPVELEGHELADRLTTEFCLPEYHALCETGHAADLNMDEMNSNLLAVRFAIPQLERVVTYQLAKRLPGSGKLPVSLACRSFLLNTFKGEWTGDINSKGSDRLVFVGMRGLQKFMGELAASCAAMGEPLPIDLWYRANGIELAVDDNLRKLIDACAFNKQGEPDQKKYQDVILGWMGSGTSAERDSQVLLTTGFRLGLKGA